jgi:hypothetical protein
VRHWEEALSVFVLLAQLACTPTANEVGDTADQYGELPASKEVGDGCPEGLSGGGEAGLCTLPIPECPHPWQLATAAGECQTVGPRTCPPSGEEVPGQQCVDGLLQCAEGFALAEDGVACIPDFSAECGPLEAPLLGGTCFRVGPKWADGGLDEVLFSECPDGQLAVPGGGCVLVGPRGCASTWDGGDLVDCLGAAPAPCPDGYHASEDELWCDPGYTKCPAGERALVGGLCQRVVAAEEECPETLFPVIPEGCSEVRYVLAGSGCAENCGSLESPFPDFAGAMVGASAGACILVGPGDYSEGLLLTTPITVAGVCAAKVKLQSAVMLPEGTAGKVKGATIGIVGATDVYLSNLTVVGAEVGIAVIESAPVALDSVIVQDCVGVALYASEKSSVSAFQLWIHDVLEGPEPGFLGQAIWLEDGADLEMTDSLIEDAVGRGIYASDPGTTLDLSESTIREVGLSESGLGGEGVLSRSDSAVKLHRVLIEEVHSVAVRSFIYTDLEIAESLFRNIHPNSKKDLGKALWLSSDAHGVAADCVFEGANKVAVAVEGGGTELSLVRTVVQSPAEVTTVWGLDAWAGAHLAMEGCLVQDSKGMGVAAYDSGTTVTVSGTIVRRTVDPGTVGGGNGAAVAVSTGAAVSLTSSLLEDNQPVGVLADLGSSLFMEGSVVRRTQTDGKGQDGMGVLLNGATGTIVSSLLDANHTEGVVVAGTPDGQLLLEDSVVRNTEVNGDGVFGRGAYVYDGAGAQVFRSIFEANREVGVMVAKAGATLYAEDSIMRENLPFKDGTMGRGLEVTTQGRASLSRCIMRGNHGVGILLGETGTELVIDESAVLDTRHMSDDAPGRGIMCQYGGQLELSRSVVSGNRNVAISGIENCAAKITASVVRDTLPDPDGHAGYGLQWIAGGEVEVIASLLHNNTGIGAVVGDHAGLVLRRAIVRETASGDDPALMGGIGLGASYDSYLEIHDSLVDANRKVGISVSSAKTEFLATRSIIRGTQPASDGLYGQGLVARNGARAELDHCLVDNNRTYGVAVAENGSELLVSNCQISSTARGGGPLGDDSTDAPTYGGDGLFIFLAEGVVSSSFVAHNARTGILVRESSATIEESLVFSNDSYGLAMMDCADQVQHSEGNNTIVSNASEMAEGYRQQITDSPGDMPVAPLPDAVKLVVEPE